MFLENGSERNNTFRNNLVVCSRNITISCASAIGCTWLCAFHQSESLFVLRPYAQILHVSRA